MVADTGRNSELTGMEVVISGLPVDADTAVADPDGKPKLPEMDVVASSTFTTEVAGVDDL